MVGLGFSLELVFWTDLSGGVVGNNNSDIIDSDM